MKRKNHSSKKLHLWMKKPFLVSQNVSYHWMARCKRAHTIPEGVMVLFCQPRWDCRNYVLILWIRQEIAIKWLLQHLCPILWSYILSRRTTHLKTYRTQSNSTCLVWSYKWSYYWGKHWFGKIALKYALPELVQCLEDFKNINYLWNKNFRDVTG